MKRNAILFVLAVLVIGGYLGYSYLTGSSMNSTDLMEDTSFSMEMPKAFYEEMDNMYANDKTDMIVEWYYYDNEIDLDAEGIMNMVEYSAFAKGDFEDVDEIEIDGVDAYQAQYRTLSTGNDGVHYYYEGVINVIPLEDEFIILDAYKWMDEADGINSNISDSDMQLLKDMVDTVEITDDDYDNVVSFTQDYPCDKLNLTLTDNWTLDTTHESGYYDFGYYTSYGFETLALWIDVTEYNDDNASDVSYAADGAMEDGVYSYVGEDTLGGETVYMYSYNGYTSDDEVYMYGVYALTNHYVVDIYFYSYNDDFKLDEDTIEKMAEIVMAAD